MLAPLVAIANILVCVCGIVLSRSIFVIYWFGALFVTAPIALDYATATYQRPVIALALGYCFLFNALLLSTQILSGVDRRSRALARSIEVWPPLPGVCIVLAGLGVIMLLLSVPSLSALAEMRWDELAESRSGMEIVYINLSQTFTVLSTAIVVPALLSRRYLIPMVVVLATVFAVALLTRSKAYALILTLPFLVYFALERDRLLSTRYFRRLAVLAVVFVLLYVGVEFARWVGPLRGLLRGQSHGQVFVAVLSEPLEADLRRTYYAILEGFRERPTLRGASYTRLLLVPIGRMLGVRVPENPIYLYYGLTTPPGTSLLRGSNHPTIYGDSYANFREFGVFVAVGLALAVSALWRWGLQHHRFLLWATVSVSSFGVPLILRGSVFYGLYAVTVGLVVAVVIDAFLRGAATGAFPVSEPHR